MNCTFSPFRAVVLLALLGCGIVPGWCGAATRPAAEVLYREGRLPSGAPLRGEREGGAGIEGPAAACTSCHRQSGLGTAEGRIVVPPITAKYLFRRHSTNIPNSAAALSPGRPTTREPYTDATLARAIRSGVSSSGRPLNYLMPRYSLDDATMALLITYLKGLSADAVPGVTDSTLHFATIVTPDADPVARRGMLAVMEAFFADKNSFIRGGVRPMHASREIEYRVSRQWQLHVWELTGPPGQWEAQLRRHLEAEPVYAVIAGLGGPTWEPVHRFCQQAKLPCLLPNVDLPAYSDGDFYSLYFSRGVLLDADLVAHRLTQLSPDVRPRRLVQIFRDGDVGKQAAELLGAATAATGMSAESRAIPREAAPGPALASAMAGLGPDDAIMLWLRPPDLAALPATPPGVATVYVSGTLGSFEHAPLPGAWRTTVRMAYPFDVPQGRQIRMTFPFNWFKIKKIDVVSERVQVDTYVALGILSETLKDMLDSFVRDYLIERVELMVSHRATNGYYPRLGLGPGQRFASKGGYLVRFASDSGNAIVADGDWIVP
jgi:hypothetical protein